MRTLPVTLLGAMQVRIPLVCQVASTASLQVAQAPRTKMQLIGEEVGKALPKT